MPVMNVRNLRLVGHYAVGEAETGHRYVADLHAYAMTDPEMAVRWVRAETMHGGRGILEMRRQEQELALELYVLDGLSLARVARRHGLLHAPDAGMRCPACEGDQDLPDLPF